MHIIQVESESSFWIIADAIKTFYAKHNQLPLPGSVPDMKAQSSVYVQLQNIYKAKARQDVAEVFETVRSHAHGKDILVTEVEAFCKNAAFIKLIHGAKSVPKNMQEVAGMLGPIHRWNPANKSKAQEFESDQNAPSLMPFSLLPIYLSLNATSHMPSATSSDILSTISKTIPNASSNLRLADAAAEVARAKGGELHTISALTGGMVSQEVIKIITKQYVPIDNTCIFDGITSRTQILRI
jgi:amyloid beta precursor protein binding protein 1